MSRDNPLHTIEAPTGETIGIPVTSADDQRYFTLDQLAEAREYYDEQGYCVIRGVVPAAMTAAARAAWDAEMKPYRGYVYRQATGKPEFNTINDRGFIMNPVLNLQDLETRHFGKLKAAALDIYASAPLRAAVSALIDADPKLVQSMYFEGNSATWAHQDTYYLDSENIGGMVAAWIALEDIKPGAGRFYIYPGSHRIDIEKNGGDFDIAFHHDRYKQLIIDVIAKYKLECRAPAVDAGDVVLWNARTIHGSLVTNQPEFSRSSLTAHFIPAQDRFLQFQSRIKRTALAEHRGLVVQKPKNQDLVRNRAILAIETSFPKSYKFVRDRAIKLLTR
jgi:phytanoyl-CoA hydroxylase